MALLAFIINVTWFPLTSQSASLALLMEAGKTTDEMHARDYSHFFAIPLLWRFVFQIGREACTVDGI